MFNPHANLGNLSFGTPSDTVHAFVQSDATGGLLNVGTLTAGSEIVLLSGNGAEAVRIDGSQNVGVGTDSPAYLLDVAGASAIRELSADSANPAEGSSVEWMSDGTGAGEDGDILRKITAGGSTITCLVAPFTYADISVTDNTTATTISSAGVAVQVTIFDTNGPALVCVPDHTNDHITVTRAGTYAVACTATVNSIAGAASRFEVTVRKNNGVTLVSPIHVDRNIAGGGGNSGSVAMAGLATLAAADTIEVWIENETNAQNYVIENIALILNRVGT